MKANAGWMSTLTVTVRCVGGTIKGKGVRGADERMWAVSES